MKFQCTTPTLCSLVQFQYAKALNAFFLWHTIQLREWVRQAGADGGRNVPGYFRCKGELKLNLSI